MMDITTPQWQVQITSQQNPKMIRDLSSTEIGKMIVIPGIITSTSKATIKATSLTVRCKNCGHMKVFPVKGGFRGV
jgi:DNA replication licensing factor MCM5